MTLNAMNTRRRDTEANIMSELTDGITGLPAKLMLIVSAINTNTKEVVTQLEQVREEVKLLPTRTSSKEILAEFSI